MPEMVQVNHALEVIEVLSVGAVTHEPIAASTEKILRSGDEAGMHRVLVDVARQRARLQWPGWFGSMGNLPKTFPIVLLQAADQILKELEQLCQTVAGNRSLALKRFTNRNQAVGWLAHP